MKTVMKENRVEQIADVELEVYRQNGWREIDPKTGKPIPKAGKPDTENQLRKQIDDLTNDLKGYYNENAEVRAHAEKLAAERDALKAENAALTADAHKCMEELADTRKQLAEALKSLKKQEKADSK